MAYNSEIDLLASTYETTARVAPYPQGVKPVRGFSHLNTHKYLYDFGAQLLQPYNTIRSHYAFVGPNFDSWASYLSSRYGIAVVSNGTTIEMVDGTPNVLLLSRQNDTIRLTTIDKPTPESPDTFLASFIKWSAWPMYIGPSFFASPYCVRQVAAPFDGSYRYGISVPIEDLVGITSVMPTVNPAYQQEYVYNKLSYNAGAGTPDMYLNSYNVAMHFVRAYAMYYSTLQGTIDGATSVLTQDLYNFSTAKIVARQGGKTLRKDGTVYKDMYAAGLFGADYKDNNASYNQYYPGDYTYNTGMMGNRTRAPLVVPTKTKYASGHIEILAAALSGDWTNIDTEEVEQLDTSLTAKPCLFGFQFSLNMPYGYNPASNKYLQVHSMASGGDLEANVVALYQKPSRAAVESGWNST